MSLQEEQVQALHEFCSGARHWEQWPRWLAVNALRLAKQLPREQFSRLKKDPHSVIPEVLKDYPSPTLSASPVPVILRDPPEKDPAMLRIIEEAEGEAMRTLGVNLGEVGICHQVWKLQKQILKEKHDIEWQSPADLNDEIIFD